MKAPLAWRLDIGLPHMTDTPKPPGTVWRVSPGYFGEPPGPDIPADYQDVATVGGWQLAAACRDGRSLG